MSRPAGLWLAQITGRPLDPDHNRSLSLQAAAQGFQAGAQIVLLPELVVPGYVLDAPGQRAVAEPVDGPTVRAWHALAAAHGGYIAGGFAEIAPEGLFNTAVIVGPEGLLLHYRKLHLFDAEKDIFTPGDKGLPIARTPLGTLGLCVCYDLRFVEVARLLALRGAEVVLVPTAWVMGFDRQAWDAEGYCPQARGAALQANLNQVFIACASQAGESGGTTFLGSSLLADPYGRTLAGPLPGDRAAASLTVIDLEEAQRALRRSPRITPRADRRTDVYGLWDGAAAL